MAYRPCLSCGVITDQTRCPTCRATRERTRDARRGGTTARGYGAGHQRERAEWEPVVATGTVVCRRCGLAIRAGQAWDLGHPDGAWVDKAPEHMDCNRGKRVPK